MSAKGNVSEVEVAAVTAPTAPLLKVTELSFSVVLKPEPLITRVEASALIDAVLRVTSGATVATCTALPLLTELVVST